ncbi:MAG: hypothetical protein K0R61_820 [Microvirga sp.]|jgi:hypothetical protein|nr:hypothetical protein [Microvirga sp.]
MRSTALRARYRKGEKQFFSARQQESDGTAEVVCQGVDFGRASSARAPDSLIALPPLAPEGSGAPSRRNVDEHLRGPAACTRERMEEIKPDRS